jgi:hypothetical protein
VEPKAPQIPTGMPIPLPKAPPVQQKALRQARWKEQWAAHYWEGRLGLRQEQRQVQRRVLPKAELLALLEELPPT